MRGKTARIIMLGGAVVILAVALFLSLYLTDDTMIMDSLVIKGEADGQTVELALWKDETDGKYYLFLPSWFSGKSSELTLCYTDTRARIWVDDTAYKNNEVWKEDGQEAVHQFRVMGLFGNELLHTTVEVVASADLPSIFVSVEDKDGILQQEDYTGKRRYLETGYLEMRDEEGKILCQEELDRFKVRGNLTSTFQKKPYSFYFKKDISVLGMSPAKKWNLLADATDGSHVRNKVIRDLAYDCIDSYEPQGKYVDLYLNGVYQGLYLVTETVEIGENRIHIDADQNWFVEMELNFRAREDETQIITDRGQIFIVHTEKHLSEKELEEIRNRLNDIESALYAPDGISTVSGKPLEKLIDLESFAEAWLVEELSGDHDIGITSQFMYALRDEDSVWHAGPVWDFDGAMGNVNTPMYGVPEALTSVVVMSRPDDNPNQNRWLSVMWNYPKFQQIVKDKYRNSFRAEYEKLLKEGIDEYVEQIRQSAVLDAFRWHKYRLDWWFVVPKEAEKYRDIEMPEDGNYRVFDTLDLSVDVVKDFMSRKLAFLDKLWLEGREFCIVEVRNSAPFLDQGYNQTLYYWVEKGKPIENLPDYEAEGYRFEGYYDKDSEERITDGFIIEYNRILEGRWTEGE